MCSFMLQYHLEYIETNFNCIYVKSDKSNHFNDKCF